MQDRLNEILASFNLNIKCVSYKKVRNISLYDLVLSPGVRIKSLQKFLDEIALMLKAKARPLIKVLSETGIVRLEIIDEAPHLIPLFQNRIKPSLSLDVPVYLGSSLDGQDIWFDMAKNPHMFVAGCTGSGKSTLLHTIMANLLIDNETSIYLSDPKGVEFKDYATFSKVKVADDYKSTVELLQSLHYEMEYRYSMMQAGLVSYLEVKKELGYVVLIIDEFADLVLQDENKKLNGLLCRLAQKCRAAGIFCILATQRPSVDVLNGTIKANFPARIACQVASHTDAKIILGQTGAELLAGNGDAIIKNYKYNFQRFQSSYTNSKEVVQKCHYA